MTPNEDKMKRLLEAIFAVHQDGCIDCDTCSAQFECLVEMVANGAQLGSLIPAVEEHLRCCPDCNEEFQALVCIIRAQQDGKTDLPV